jgi:hypothetical protein
MDHRAGEDASFGGFGQLIEELVPRGGGDDAAHDQDHGHDQTDER